MIKKIKKLKFIRSFINFNSDIELDKKNIIYSPNGIGKTNLSRFFEYLKNEKKDINKLKSQEADNLDKIEYSFLIDQIEVNQDNFEQHRELLKTILIFNSDYIEENIRCKNFSEKDVSGEINIPIGKEGTEVNKLEELISISKTERKKRYDTIENEIKKHKELSIKQKKYQLKDRKIWEEFTITKIINNSSYEILEPINQKEFLTCENNFKDIDNLDEDQKISFSLKELDISNIDFQKIKEDLENQKIFITFDEDIKNDIKYLTENWISTELIEKGVIQSKTKNECLFCKRDLDNSVNSLFDKYEKYFADDEAKFKKQINDIKKEIEEFKTGLGKINNNLKDSVLKLISLLGTKEQWKDLDISILFQKIEELIEKLSIKENDPTQVITINLIGSDGKEYDYDFLSEIKNLNNNIKNNQNLIESLNEKITKTSVRKTELRTLIGKKLLYEFYQANDININKIKEYNKDIKENSILLREEKKKLPKVEVSKNIQELCNTFLHEYLRINKYSVVENNGILFLQLKTKDISHETEKISEGEKNMIALCYFLASSIQQLNSSDKYLSSIFIIDDPLCSSSYNYFFGICNLIKFFEDVIFNKLWKVDINKIQQSNLQKIILTHNTPFFNMLRGHVYKEKSLYFILDNENLKTIPQKQLKSEFEMALYNIKKASSTPDSDHNIGNDLRRFFETLKHFYGFEGEFNAESLKKIFSLFDENDHIIFYSVIQYYSHGNPESHNDPLPTNFKPFIEQFSILIKDSQFNELWNKIKID